MPLEGNESGAFPKTHWTVIASVAGPDRDRALSRLYRNYWRPLCLQAQRFGVSADDVEDVVQELFMSLFQSGAMERADRLSGRFRSYLLGALRNHLSHRRARAQTQKRGGLHAVVPLEEFDVSQMPGAAPEEAWEFDAEWARALLEEAQRRFHREVAHTEESRASFAVLGGSALGDEELSTEEAARRLGITGPAVKSRIFRLRQRFHEIVREEVLRTVSNPEECEEELRYLSAVLEKIERVPATSPCG